MRRRLFLKTATRWRRRSASKWSGGSLRSRRETLRKRGTTSQRLLFASAGRYFLLLLLMSSRRLFQSCVLSWHFVRCILQKRAFEEDRAAWLKNHFLNLTPFTDRRRWSSSDCQSALSVSKSAYYIKWWVCALIFLLLDVLYDRKWIRDQYVFSKSSEGKVFNLHYVFYS